jgi:hypothetical protein
MEAQVSTIVEVPSLVAIDDGVENTALGAHCVGVSHVMGAMAVLILLLFGQPQ